MPDRTVGNHAIDLSNLDKVFYPEAGVSKGDVIDYYEGIAEVMLPHLEDRPLSMKRYPDGLSGEGFFQKEIGDYFPDWIDREKIQKSGGSNTQVICNTKATLVYLANQACLTPHVWLSRRSHLDKPDRMVFDIDPPGDDFSAVRRAAQQVADVLQELDLPVYYQTTGSKGVHVVVPLQSRDSFDDVRKFAADLAELVANRHASDLTTAVRKEKRQGRVFLDTNRNAYGQTMVAPYSLRAREGAPIATPITANELGRSDLHARSYTIKNISRRLAQREDPWKDINRHAHTLTRARKKLDAILKKEE